MMMQNVNYQHDPWFDYGLFREAELRDLDLLTRTQTLSFPKRDSKAPKRGRRCQIGVR